MSQQRARCRTGRGYFSAGALGICFLPRNLPTAVPSDTYISDPKIELPIIEGRGRGRLGESLRQDPLFYCPMRRSIGTLDVDDLHPLAPRREFALESIPQRG